MRGANQPFLRDTHVEEVNVIKGVTFTPREIDVISCLMHMRGPSKISSLLSISSHTVVAHIRNIRLKIGCHSREGIIDFIEQSVALPLINKHYAHLSLHVAFEKCLKDIAQIKGKRTQAHLLIYGEIQWGKADFIKRLEKHLKQAGIDGVIERMTVNENISVENLKNEGHTLLLFWGDRERVPNELSTLDSLNLSAYKAYYFLVFEILKKLFYPINIAGYVQNFHDQYRSLTITPMNELPPFYKSNTKRRKFYKKYFFIFVISCCAFICYIFYVLKEGQKVTITQDQQQENQQEALIRLELPLPVSSVLLERPEEIAQIDAKLKGEKGIQSIALVGPGGIGKTTLARQYAQLQKPPIVWEMNAETRETLLASFEALALALAQTEQEKEDLKKIKRIKNFTEKEDKIVQWVKTHLSDPATI